MFVVVWLVHPAIVSFAVAGLRACCIKTSTKLPHVQHSCGMATVIQVRTAQAAQQAHSPADRAIVSCNALHSAFMPIKAFALTAIATMLTALYGCRNNRQHDRHRCCNILHYQIMKLYDRQDSPEQPARLIATSETLFELTHLIMW